jgi:hypothetical protein
MGGGSIPPRLDEDNPTNTAMTTMLVDELDGTRGILSRQVGSINMGTMLDPLEFGDTRARQGC